MKLSITCLFILGMFFSFVKSIKPQNGGGGVPFSQPSNSGYRPDGSMDLTQAKSTEERKVFIQTAGKVQPGTNFLEHLFELQGNEDFNFILPVDQQVAFYIYVYVSEDNSFVRIRDVEQQPAVRLAVYEGPNNLIVRTDIFFQRYIIFNGKKNTQYTLKFQTSGNKKLVSLSLKLFVQTVDIEGTLTEEHASNYSKRTKAIKSHLLTMTQSFGMYWALDENNMKSILKRIKKYYYYQLFQIVIALGITVFQVRMIFRLLRQQSII